MQMPRGTPCLHEVLVVFEIVYPEAGVMIDGTVQQRAGPAQCEVGLLRGR